MNKLGKFYGIGVGPGDPALITMKAAQILSKVDMVIAPAADKESLALKIAQPYINCKVIEMNFPMISNKNTLNDIWDKNVKIIQEILQEGNDTAFITLGDPMIYSTYTYILSRLCGYEIETIPGITSFCAAASKVNIPIAEGDAPFAVIPVKDKKLLEKTLKDFDNVILMKISRNYDEVVRALKENGFCAVLITHCGQEDERIEFDLDKYLGRGVSYLSLIIAWRDKK